MTLKQPKLEGKKGAGRFVLFFNRIFVLLRKKKHLIKNSKFNTAVVSQRTKIFGKKIPIL